MMTVPISNNRVKNPVKNSFNPSVRLVAHVLDL